MTTEERLVADFHGTGMTVGPHPMHYHRAQMKSEGALTAIEYKSLKSRAWRVTANSESPGAQAGALEFGTDAVRDWQ